MKVTDLSHKFRITDMVFPGTEPMFTRNSHTIAEQGYNLSMVTVNSHAGTHTDAFSHFVDGAKSLGEIGIEQYVGPCYVLDCMNKGDCYHITVEDLKPYEEQIRKARRVILATGWGKHVNTDKFYTDFPRVSPEAAQYLVDLGVITLGVEPPTVHADKGKEVHEILLGNEMVVIEGLTNLEGLLGKEIILCAAPLCFEGMDGFPLRAYAIEL